MQASCIIEVVEKVSRSGDITTDDVLALRRQVFGDGKVHPYEAEALFDLAQKRLPGALEWHDFYIEAMTDYLVHQEEPSGYISEANAAWLARMIERDGVVWSDTELELMIHVIDRAKSSPPELVRYAMRKVRDAVVTGEGPTRRGKALKSGSIGVAEVDLLRRILYAFGGDGAVSITRCEAEALFEINDATLNGDNDPAWADLFVKAIANHLMALSGYRVPCRQEALRRERWLEDTSVSVSGFLGRMAAGWRDVFRSYQPPQSARAQDMALAERITEEEASWLRERILDNGRVCDNQQALLAFIRENSPQVHPQLKPLLQQAA